MEEVCTCPIEVEANGKKMIRHALEKLHAKFVKDWEFSPNHTEMVDWIYDVVEEMDFAKPQPKPSWKASREPQRPTDREDDRCAGH